MSRYVILGASSGIGAALTARLAAAGHTVWAGARRVGVMRHLFAEAQTIHPLYCDAERENSQAEFWRHIQWSGGCVDGLVVTVGAQGEINTVVDSDPDAWFRTLMTNLYGPYLAVRYGLPHLAPTGRIVLCAGGGSHRPWPHYSAYACAKAGVVRLVETLAQEIPQPVNALAPGMCATPIHQATLQAGYKRAGGQYLATSNYLYVHTQHCTVDPAIGIAVDCARWLLQEAPAALTGRTISAQHDPWATDPNVLLQPDAGTTLRVKPDRSRTYTRLTEDGGVVTVGPPLFPFPPDFIGGSGSALRETR